MSETRARRSARSARSVNSKARSRPPRRRVPRPRRASKRLVRRHRVCSPPPARMPPPRPPSDGGSCSPLRKTTRSRSRAGAQRPRPACERTHEVSRAAVVEAALALILPADGKSEA